MAGNPCTGNHQNNHAGCTCAMRERNPCRRRVLTPEADYDRLQSGVGAVEPDELPRAGKARRPLIICNDVLVNGLPLQMVCKVIRRSTRARGCRSLFACRCDRKPPSDSSLEAESAFGFGRKNSGIPPSAGGGDGGGDAGFGGSCGGLTGRGSSGGLTAGSCFRGGIAARKKLGRCATSSSTSSSAGSSSLSSGGSGRGSVDSDDAEVSTGSEGSSGSGVGSGSTTTCSRRSADASPSWGSVLSATALRPSSAVSTCPLSASVASGSSDSETASRCARSSLRALLGSGVALSVRGQRAHWPHPALSSRPALLPRVRARVRARAQHDPDDGHLWALSAL